MLKVCLLTWKLEMRKESNYKAKETWLDVGHKVFLLGGPYYSGNPLKRTPLGPNILSVIARCP